MSAPSAARTASHIELISGDKAFALLEDESFKKAWSELAAACPWSTSCQSWAFAETWYSVYRNSYEPLLIVQHDETGGLCGLFPLAIEIASAAIVHVGAHQSEYQVWLALHDHAESFIEQSLDELAKRFPKQRLHLQYLPPGSPVGWCHAGSRWGSRSLLRSKRRPLMALGAGSRVEESLRKKSNKSRINRLKKIAPLTLTHMRTRAELERVIDTIAEYCDLRQGAINASLPFGNDPNKREFCLRMLEKPDLLHASVLMSGDTVVAANLGLISGTFVSIGVLVHSPFLAEHSPGKLLILLLARQLGEQGFVHLDLTPGGDAYKERSADDFDEVHILTVHFDRMAYARDVAIAGVRTVTANTLGERGRTLVARARRWAGTSVTGMIGSALKAVARAIYNRTNIRYYIVDPAQARQVSVRPLFKVNCVADLLAYEPQLSARGKMDFLADAARRLEAGERSYTLVENGVLIHCAWTSFPEKRNAKSNELACPAHACLIADEWTHPTARDRKLAQHSVAQRLQDAATMPQVEAILIKESGDVSTENARPDFQVYGSEIRKTWFGFQQTRSCFGQ